MPQGTTRICLQDRAIVAKYSFWILCVYIARNMEDSFVWLIFWVQEFRYTDLGKSLGPIVEKAVGFESFGDLPLDGFLRVAPLVVKFVSFREHRRRTDDL